MEKIYQISNFVFYLRFLSLHPPQKIDKQYHSISYQDPSK